MPLLDSEISDLQDRLSPEFINKHLFQKSDWMDRRTVDGNDNKFRMFRCRICIFFNLARLPVGIETAERSYFTLKRLKTWLKEFFSGRSSPRSQKLSFKYKERSHQSFCKITKKIFFNNSNEIILF